MANNSHSPLLEGEIKVITKDGKVKETHYISQNNGYAKVKAEVRDTKGNLKKSQTFPMKSFLKNMAYGLLTNFEGYVSSTDAPAMSTGNTIGLLTEMDVTAIANDSSYGIIVGSNSNDSGYNPAISTLVDKDDYSLRYQYVHGTGTNQLSHGATTVTYTSNAELEIERSFTNNSGATITIGEIGVVVSNGSKEFLIVRDVDTSVDFPYEETGTRNSISIDVADTEVLTLTYTFNIGDTDGLLNNWIAFLASKLGATAETVETCEVNTSSSTASVDFHANPTYAKWTASSGDADLGLLVGDNSAATSRNEIALLDINQNLTYAEQSEGEVSHPVNGYDLVKNSNGTWKVYKTYVGVTRKATNATGSSVTLKEAAITLAGSASTARVPIIRFKLNSDITLNDTETIEVTIKVSMVSNVEELTTSGS